MDMDIEEAVMIDRFWGEENDREAAKQLGLGGEYTIFMMGDQAEHLPDIDSVSSEFEQLGLIEPGDVIDAVKDHIQPVLLPPGFALVGLRPVGAGEPCVYGVVDFSAMGRG
jgi:hypothetical protein